MKLALDTNAYTALARGDVARVHLIQTATEIFIPFVVLGELRAGFAAGSLVSSNEMNLLRFLASSRVSVLFPDDETTRHYAQVFAQLRTAGKPIPTNDLWIAAMCLQHRLTLCSGDAHFQHIPQLQTC